LATETSTIALGTPVGVAIARKVVVIPGTAVVDAMALLEGVTMTWEDVVDMLWEVGVAVETGVEAAVVELMGVEGRVSSPSWIVKPSDRVNCQSLGFLASPNMRRARAKILYRPVLTWVPLAKLWNLVKPTLLNRRGNLAGKST
jgi:hypothetical protein